MNVCIFLIFIFNVHECSFACMYCAICVSGTHRGQKMVPHTLKVMLQVVVSQNVGVRTQTQVYCKSNKCSQL